MKTILYLSIVLMLMAGTAGAINFAKMYHTGEIDKIYQRDEPVPVHTAKAATVTAISDKPVLPPLPDLKEIRLYSRAIPELIEDADIISSTDSAVDADNNAANTSDTVILQKNQEPVATSMEPAKKRASIPFNAKMFSRAPLKIRQPIELTEDDSVSIKTPDTVLRVLNDTSSR